MFTMKAEAYQRQAERGYALLGGYLHYAISIGCKVHGDEIEANYEQAVLLDKWWKENTDVT